MKFEVHKKRLMAYLRKKGIKTRPVKKQAKPALKQLFGE